MRGGDGCGAVWNLSEPSDSAGEAIRLGTFRSGFYPCWLAVLFCKRNFIPWRRFVHICNDFIKKKQNKTGCVLPAKGLCVFISFWKVGLQRLREDLATHANLPWDRRPHTHLLSLLCSWEHPKGRVGLSSTLGLSNTLGELVQQFKVSAQKHRLYMT